ncbi:MAG TPA: 50S ribosomal protein L25/general stress protein Ctc [Actinomycetales bacterium]|nr:50S ribosomal protein L25/general stress protein Ctc [Actinomycetales bacterium]
MAANKLSVAKRTEFGKGAARRARRDGLIPAVLYGHGTDPVHIALPSHETFLIVRTSRNAVIELDVEGEEQLALVKDVQIDPVVRQIEHLDLIIVKRGEKVTVNVPVITEGETEPGTIHQVEMMELSVLAPAISIPDSILVNIDGLDDGAVIRVGDIELPEDVTTEVDPEAAVVIVSIPKMEEAPEGEDAELAEGEEAPEGEEGAEAGAEDVE